MVDLKLKCNKVTFWNTHHFVQACHVLRVTRLIASRDRSTAYSCPRRNARVDMPAFRPKSAVCEQKTLPTSMRESFQRKALGTSTDETTEL